MSFRGLQFHGSIFPSVIVVAQRNNFDAESACEVYVHVRITPLSVQVLRAFDEMYHPDCFRCTVCGVCLDGVPYAGKSHDKVYCIEDYHK